VIKSLMQLLMVRRQYHLELKNILTIHYIKMMKERIDILIVIREMKIGDYQVLIQLVFMQKYFME
jgi:hypothetical protein